MKRKQFTKAERQKIWQKCNGHCAYCGCDLPYEKMQVDHIRSISTAEWNKIKTGVVQEVKWDRKFYFEKVKGMSEE